MQIFFAFVSALNPGNEGMFINVNAIHKYSVGMNWKNISLYSCFCYICYSISIEMGKHLMKHGDGVKDIAFQVEDCDFIVKVTH